MHFDDIANGVLQSARDDHVLVLRIHRPEARNAINVEVAMALGDALDAADRDPDIRAIIITGAGDKAFCAGADLKSVAARQPVIPQDERRKAWGFAGVVNHPISKPLIAAVNGFAMGGGTEIVLACDLAVASDTATFGLPEVKRGLLAAAGGAFRLVQQVPHKIAMEILLTGDPVSADQALNFGLVNAVVSADALMDRAMDLARRIAVNAPLSVQASKRVARRLSDGRFEADEADWHRNEAETEAVFSSEDAMEGAQAFAEKRPPVWRAR
ncbi:crotonase/enoyl-CoA hydratase family protein [Sphingobium fluviale]|uniref:Crotonase/enoyl-CoA hydratase family protein n=1 Tax=Sphingobium fluviale TaxID=2506423 RepID=A0A4Q1KJY8_9SPHN|nr:crotonase/enoyl-CoA hydratase family protein [Sphingobium fluviale]RXR29519.1 crotonase/enoyl-CoA hydratase family protein [Sphingobium fluviale]